MKQLKITHPSFDVERLACMLENHVVIYEREGVFNANCYAYNTKDQTGYPLIEGKTPDMEAFSRINYHEFKHLVSQPCPDEVSNDISLSASGIDIDYKYDSNKEFMLEEGYFGKHLPFYYSFIEEAEADNYINDYLNLKAETYNLEAFILENMELSLFLEEGFTLDAFMTCGLYHNPIALIQQFPIPDGTQEEEEQWLIAQLQMLECYNITSDYMKFYMFSSLEEEDRKESLSALQMTADIQMLRNFLLNLSTYSTTNYNITEEDYYYLLHLFEYRLEVQRNKILEKQEVNSISTIHYEALRDDLLKEFFTIFTKDEYEWEKNYNQYKLSDGKLSDAFTEEQKEYFQNKYLECIEYEESYSQEESADKRKILYKD